MNETVKEALWLLKGTGDMSHPLFCQIGFLMLDVRDFLPELLKATGDEDSINSLLRENHPLFEELFKTAGVDSAKETVEKKWNNDPVNFETNAAFRKKMESFSPHRLKRIEEILTTLQDRFKSINFDKYLEKWDGIVLPELKSQAKETYLKQYAQETQGKLSRYESSDSAPQDWKNFVREFSQIIATEVVPNRVRNLNI